MKTSDIKDIHQRFDISENEAQRIADSSANEIEFIAIWENTDWWTDENNA